MKITTTGNAVLRAMPTNEFGKGIFVVDTEGRTYLCGIDTANIQIEARIIQGANPELDPFDRRMDEFSPSYPLDCYASPAFDLQEMAIHCMLNRGKIFFESTEHGDLLTPDHEFRNMIAIYRNFHLFKPSTGDDNTNFAAITFERIYPHIQNRLLSVTIRSDNKLIFISDMNNGLKYSSMKFYDVKGKTRTTLVDAVRVWAFIEREFHDEDMYGIELDFKDNAHPLQIVSVDNDLKPHAWFTIAPINGSHSVNKMILEKAKELCSTIDLIDKGVQ